MENMHRFPFSRRNLLLCALGGGVLLLVLGRNFASTGTPSAPPPERGPAAQIVAAPPLVVHVVGAVRRPGLYRLTQGKRIADAVARAGGATRRADLAAVNLAAPLADGQQVVVPRRLPPATAAAGSGSDRSAAPGPSGPVHLNTATLEQLDGLPGVGPVTAQRILDYRTVHGAFSAVDELDAIAGIGPARLDQLRSLVAP
jgi:competence protein ComEA